MSKQFDRGDSVMTPLGPGKVAYKRMEPPNYSEVAVYSVNLDTKASDWGYSGTIFKADEVQENNQLTWQDQYQSYIDCTEDNKQWNSV